jgi:Ca2+-binding RTX toxin-like protein
VAVGARHWPIRMLAAAAGVVALLATGGHTPDVVAQGGGATQLVLESVDVDRTGIIEPDAWTAAQGTARFAPSYGTADFSFPIPGVIPPQGAPVTLSVTATANQIFAPALGIHGDATFLGPAAQAGTVVPAGGGTASGSATVTIVPRPAAPGAAVLIYIGLQSGPRVNYRFRAESVGGCAAVQEAGLHQAPACPPPRCAGQAATLVGDEDAPGPIFGTPGRDVIVGTPGGDLILGRGGDDLICGRGGDDRISGNAGADTVNGEGGDDRIDGGDDASRDRLAGQAGTDRIVSGPGDDLVLGGTGDDARLSGGPGRDRIEGGPGDDEAAGGGGEDVVLGGPGGDTLDGGRDHDVLRGGGDGDGLLGGEGDDLVFGDAGRDALYGESGDDFLEAGPRDERDALVGGPGVDRCVGTGRGVSCERLR